MAGPLNQYYLDPFEQRFATVVKVKPGLQRMFMHLFLHCLDLLSHVVGEHWQSGLGTPASLMTVVKLHHVPPALLFSVGSQFSRLDGVLAVTW